MPKRACPEGHVLRRSGGAGQLDGGEGVGRVQRREDLVDQAVDVRHEAVVAVDEDVAGAHPGAFQLAG